MTNIHIICDMSPYYSRVICILILFSHPFMRLCEYKKVYTSNIPSSEEVIQLHANLCSALADPRRLILIYALSENPKNVSQLTSEVGISQSSVSRHLKVLRESGLVKGTRDGSNMVYEITDFRLIDALELLLAVLRDQLVYRAGLLEPGIDKD